MVSPGSSQGSVNVSASGMASEAACAAVCSMDGLPPSGNTSISSKSRLLRLRNTSSSLWGLERDRSSSKGTVSFSGSFPAMVIFPRNTSAGSGRGSSFSSCTGDGSGWGEMPRAALRSSRSLLAAARAFSSRSTAVSIFSSGFLSALKRARSSSVTGMAISGVNRSGRPAERSVECRLTPWTRCSSRKSRSSSFFSWRISFLRS